MKQLKWCQADHNQPIARIPLQFTFPPVETLMKQLTKLNSPHTQRISYLGPRWGDSVTFHKKYSTNSYPFDEKNMVKNNSIFSQTMMNNQFYKNQIFYRAFQGMNPTLDLEKQLLFQSRFEGGNLDCVVKVSDNQYDLFLRIDSNTRGNINWFYFSIRNCPNKKKIKLNICNLTKKDTHYSKGLKPFTYSSTRPYWTQDRIKSTTFRQRKLRYKFLYERLTIRTFYQLSFEVETKGGEQIKFAYCIPYNYSDLMQDLKCISSVAEIGSMGQSLTGINIPMVMIGKHDQKDDKPVLLITGRIHPGQSNSSVILSSFMKYICFSQEAQFLRQKVITIIIPMLNPDGVILGNSRCGASGKDLNREFRSRSRYMFPEVVQLKNLVDKISETHDLELYLDFHGHSKKKNMFMFGPDYNITQPQYYKCRVFPKLLSNITNIFRYYSCSYTISNDKKSTARAVMINQMMIPIVFTVESSLGFYHDYVQHKNQTFTKKKWEELGEYVVLALKEYFQGIQQYQKFIEEKRKAKKQIAQQIKQAALSTAPQPIFNVKKNITKTSPPKIVQKQQNDGKDIKMFKIFQQITELEQKRQKEDKVEKNHESEEESDSHCSEQQFQKEKMKQFSSMVNDYLQEQTKRKTSNKYVEGNKKPEKKDSTNSKILKKAQRKQRQLKMKEELIVFNDFISNDQKQKNKRPEIKTQNKQRIPKKQDIFQHRERKMKYEGLSKLYPVKVQEQEESHQDRQLFLAGHHFLDEEVQTISHDKKYSKMNVRMFNFSKVVHQPRYESRQIRIMKAQPTIVTDPYSKSLQIEYPVHKPTQVNLSQIKDEDNERKSRGDALKKYSVTDTRSTKVKSGYPSSFYRIKYHNSQRKKQQFKKEQLYDFEESPHTSNRARFVSSSNKGERELSVEYAENRKEKILARLQRFQID